MAHLEAAGSELLLFVSYADRDLAKEVQGYRWDTTRKCWIFPMEEATYRAILAKFGDGLELRGPAAFPAESPQSSTAHPGSDLSTGRRNAEPSVPYTATNSEESVSALKAHIAKQGAELRTLRAQLLAACDERDSLQNSFNAMRERNDRILSQNDALSREVERFRRTASAETATRAGVFTSELKNMVKGVAKKNTTFSLFVGSATLDKGFPLEAAKLLEKELRSKLGAYDSAGLADLIERAEAAKLITDEGKAMAHNIRAQRNKLVHDGASEATYPARMLLSLAAATLLWAEW
jgi:hypothetical protein